MPDNDDRPAGEETRREDAETPAEPTSLDDLKQASLDLKKRIEEKRPHRREAETDALRSAEVLDDPENLNNQ